MNTQNALLIVLARSFCGRILVGFGAAAGRARLVVWSHFWKYRNPRQGQAGWRQEMATMPDDEC